MGDKIKAMGVVSFRRRANPEFPYIWKLFLGQGKDFIVVRLASPIMTFSSREDAKQNAMRIAKKHGIEVEKWEGA